MKNTRDRARQRQSDPMFEFDTVNGQMIWALWRQIRRSNERRRRRAAAAGNNASLKTLNFELRGCEKNVFQNLVCRMRPLGPLEMRTALKIGQIRTRLLTRIPAATTRMTTETIRPAAGSARHRNVPISNTKRCYPVVPHCFPDEESNAQVYLRIGMSL